MIDIQQYIPSSARQTPSNWWSFNAPCCVNNGETADKRKRGGILVTDEGWVYSCFNCGFKCSFKYGKNLNFKAKKLLGWMGVDPAEISRINLESLQYRSTNDIIDNINKNQKSHKQIVFESRKLPDPALLISSQFPKQQAYLESRCIDNSYPFIAFNDEASGRDGILIPFTYDDKVVGHTVRFLDDRRPKYLSESQPGYVFGVDLQKEPWKYVIVSEGIFDALSISGLAVMHSTVSDKQADLINRLNRTVIVVPDQDKAGLDMIDSAIERNWSVSIPLEWPEGCKDINDAVCHYGRSATLLSIIQNAESNRIKIEMNRKRLKKRIS